MKKRRKKEQPLKIHGTIEQVLQAAFKKPKTKKRWRKSD